MAATTPSVSALAVQPFSLAVPRMKYDLVPLEIVLKRNPYIDKLAVAWRKRCDAAAAKARKVAALSSSSQREAATSTTIHVISFADYEKKLAEEKRFICSHCGAFYIFKHTFVDHVKSHEGPADDEPVSSPSPTTVAGKKKKQKPSKGRQAVLAGGVERRRRRQPGRVAKLATSTPVAIETPTADGVRFTLSRVVCRYGKCGKVFCGPSAAVDAFEHVLEGHERCAQRQPDEYVNCMWHGCEGVGNIGGWNVCSFADHVRKHLQLPNSNAVETFSFERSESAASAGEISVGSGGVGQRRRSSPRRSTGADAMHASVLSTSGSDNVMETPRKKRKLSPVRSADECELPSRSARRMPLFPRASSTNCPVVESKMPLPAKMQVRDVLVPMLPLPSSGRLRQRATPTLKESAPHKQDWPRPCFADGCSFTFDTLREMSKHFRSAHPSLAASLRSAKLFDNAPVQATSQAMTELPKSCRRQVLRRGRSADVQPPGIQIVNGVTVIQLD